ncbi:OmpA family protein [Mangrovimonas aestuarii]|uniref:OmpA family protein n=1 Tax=Mangrovimonas aestuarii TaxID=3018443 RepID=UPI002378F010|nr:hypothetical protein [Mangrovimonas aestuarii]
MSIFWFVMKVKLFYLFCIVVVTGIGVALNWSICCKNNLSAFENQKNNKIGELPVYPFSITDQDDLFEYHCKDNLMFYVSDYKIMKPLEKSVIIGVDSLGAYLKRSPSRMVKVTGFYGKNETNTSALSSLGLARAFQVRNFLVSYGVPSNQIDVAEEQRDSLQMYNKICIGPLSLVVFERDAVLEEQLKATFDKVKAKPLILYFKADGSTIELTVEQREKISGLFKYLSMNVEASCNIVGYSYDIENHEDNMVLGRSLANFAKTFLVAHGLPKSSVNVGGRRGWDEPEANGNKAEEYNLKSRVVITVDK